MLSAITAWFVSQGAGLVLGALAKLVLDGWNSYQSNNALREAGAARTASKVNVETLETKNAMDDVARPSDDAVADSLRSGKF
jgi:predicted negative regulator of RcsB-dependent stress response